MRTIRFAPLLLLLLGAAPARLDQPPSGPGATLALPPPGATNSASNSSNPIGWPAGRTPQAPPGFVVETYARLPSARQMLVLDNGDVLVAQSNGESSGSPNRVTVLRGINPDGSAARAFTLATGLANPFGLAVAGGFLFVADTAVVHRWPFHVGQTRVDGPGQTIFTMPGGGESTYGHWTRNLTLAPDGKSLFVSVGSSSNIADSGIARERGRAAIWRIGLDGSGARVFAGGLRNPVGTAIQPETHALWTVVNERDGLGDNLPPDYLTHVDDGGFYGWPWRYYGRHDARVRIPEPTYATASRVPDYALGAHTASLGLLFYRGQAFPLAWRGAFVGQHGSWNRARLSGYRVAFLPFEHGQPAARPLTDFLTGFVADADEATVYGRPVGLAEMKDGSLLVADDAGNRVWRVRWAGNVAAR